MQRSFIVFLFFIFKSFCINSQNLVPNSGFEDFICKPWFISSIELCNNWSNPTPQTPDYFNNFCGEFKTAGFPDKNWWGPQLPKSGNAYAGIIAYRPNKDEPSKSISEYLQVKLNEPLKAGKQYSVSIHISLAECSSFGLKRLSACFANRPINSKSPEQLNLYPQADFDVVNDTATWILLEKVFTATGGEQFMVVGLFDVRNKIKTEKVHPSKEISGPRNEAYYFIDDVSVIEMEKKITPASVKTMSDD
jgi:hypothetical protein